MEVLADTRTGQIRGTRESGIAVFRGIPYAAEPSGDLRWMPPQPMTPWTGVRDALQSGPASYQDDMGLMPASTLTGLLEVEEPESEDCLFLNVWTPDLNGSRPVMVWIHGGGFAIGSGSQFVYDGHNLCRRDVVLVSINYRMGPFGFVHLDGPTDGAIPATGNEGLLDQAAALEWVRDNIAAFGGDPENVTIFGESAGSMSVMALMTMPVAKGLFHKAIAQSGPGHNFLSRQEAAEWLGEPMLKALGNDPRDAEALRAATPEQLMTALPGFFELIGSGDPELMGRWAKPVIDGEVLPRWPEEALADGFASGVPLLAGVTRDEMATLMIPGLTEEMLVGMVAQQLPDHEDPAGLVGSYREARDARMARSDPSALMSAINSHRTMWVPTIRLLEAQQSHAPVYHYIFDWISPAGDGATGAPHAVDIAFPFGTHSANETASQFFGSGPATDALAEAVMDAWAAFAHSGNPSSEGLGDWPAYEPDARPTMMIGPRVHVARDPFSAERQAWEGVETQAMKRM